MIAPRQATAPSLPTWRPRSTPEGARLEKDNQLQVREGVVAVARLGDARPEARILLQQGRRTASAGVECLVC